MGFSGCVDDNVRAANELSNKGLVAHIALDKF